MWRDVCIDSKRIYRVYTSVFFLSKFQKHCCVNNGLSSNTLRYSNVISCLQTRALRVTEKRFSRRQDGLFNFCTLFRLPSCTCTGKYTVVDFRWTLLTSTPDLRTTRTIKRTFTYTHSHGTYYRYDKFTLRINVTFLNIFKFTRLNASCDRNVI